MNPVYSIVIPVYNAEKYLDDCIASVLAQKSSSVFEIILVNDGSRDNSPVICDRYAQLDARFVVIHQKNQGVSVARNNGILAAKGQYVLFLDSDDRLDAELLQSMDTFVSKAPDMIEFEWRYFSDSGEGKRFPLEVSASGETGEALFAKHEKLGIMPIVTCWAAAFRREFLLEQQLVFPAGVSYGEDFCFCLHCLKQAQSVYSVTEPLYWYRINEMSVTHTLTLKKIKDLLEITVEIYRLFPSALLADYYCMRIWRIETLKPEDAKQLKGFLQENRDILQHISGGLPRIARMSYCLFGWYRGAKVLRVLSNIVHLVRG